jgi:hypothetical protein
MCFLLRQTPRATGIRPAALGPRKKEVSQSPANATVNGVGFGCGMVFGCFFGVVLLLIVLFVACKKMAE